MKISEKLYPGRDFNRGPISRCLQSSLCLPSTECNLTWLEILSQWSGGKNLAAPLNSLIDNEHLPVRGLEEHVQVSLIFAIIISFMLTWRNRRLPSPTRINLSVCSSVRLSVRACRLGIEHKMAQAQQIWSTILQNHESTWIVNQKFFEMLST